MENEEIRGLIHKNAYEDQSAGFSVLGLLSVNLLSVHVWSNLIILSLSHSWSLRFFLEHSSFGSRKEKQSKGKEGKQGSRKEEKDQASSTGILAGNLLHV